MTGQVLSLSIKLPWPDIYIDTKRSWQGKPATLEDKTAGYFKSKSYGSVAEKRKLMLFDILFGY